MPKRGYRSHRCVRTWQPDLIFMMENCNPIQVSLSERDNLIPIHTPQLESQVHHQDHRARGDSWHTIIYHYLD